MKKRILLLLWSLMFILSSSILYSQDLSKYYISYTQEEGDLYFIYPFTEYKNIQDGSTLSFDITYLESQDSATLNFTYLTDKTFKADSLCLLLTAQNYCYTAEKIYQDFKKKKWENRFGLKLPIGDLIQFSKSESPPSLRIISIQSRMDYSVKQKKWDEYQSAIDKILYIIQPDEN